MTVRLVDSTHVTVSDDGLTVTADGHPPRRVPWNAVLALPAAWGVCSDGWLVGTYPTERDAHDKAADLRAGGADVRVVAIPAGVTLPG